MDVEKARGLLDAIISANSLGTVNNGAVDNYARRALRALGDEAEEWVAAPDTALDGDWAVWRNTGKYTRQIIVGGLTEATARRVAALPRLERAADRAVQALDDWATLWAPTECGEKRIRDARQRVGEHGTLAYIAEIATELRAARKEGQ